MSIDIEEFLTEAMTQHVEGVALDLGLVRTVVRRRARHRRAGQGAIALSAAVAVAGGAVALRSPGSARQPASITPAASVAPTQAAGPTGTPTPATDPFPAELVDSYLPATGAQATAGNTAAAELDIMVDKAVAACRQRSGLPATEPSTSGPTSGLGSVSALADTFMDPTQYPDRAWFTAHGSFTAFTSTLPVGLGAPPTQCVNSEVSKATFPSLRTWRSFLASWFTTVSAAESSAAVRASLVTFRSCVIAAGAVPRDGSTFTGEGSGADGASASAFADFIGFASGPADGADFAAREKPWVPVFNRCAGPTIDLLEAAQLAARATFQAAHASEIAQLQHQTETELAAAIATYGAPTP